MSTETASGPTPPRTLGAAHNHFVLTDRIRSRNVGIRRGSVARAAGGLLARHFRRDVAAPASPGKGLIPLISERLRRRYHQFRSVRRSLTLYASPARLGPLMKCPRCQHDNETGAKFCEECAAPLARACAKCGRSLSSTAKFCPECAHPTGLPAAPPPAHRFDSPEAYTPEEQQASGQKLQGHLAYATRARGAEVSSHRYVCL
jgi:hypothetical protein